MRSFDAFAFAVLFCFSRQMLQKWIMYRFIAQLLPACTACVLDAECFASLYSLCVFLQDLIQVFEITDPCIPTREEPAEATQARLQVWWACFILFCFYSNIGIFFWCKFSSVAWLLTPWSTCTHRMLYSLALFLRGLSCVVMSCSNYSFLLLARLYSSFIYIFLLGGTDAQYTSTVLWIG